MIKPLCWSVGNDLRFYPMRLAYNNGGLWFGSGATYMVIYRFEDLFGSNQQRGHLPDGHFKVHLGKLEQSRWTSVPLFGIGLVLRAHEPLEEAWHAHAGPVAGGGAEIDRTGMLTRNRDVRVHGRGLESRSFKQRRRFLVALVLVDVSGLCHRHHVVTGST